MILSALLWIAYYGLHSLLASQTVKDWMQGRLGRYFHWYRLAYNAFAIVSFAGIWWFQSQLPQPSLWDRPVWALLLVGALFLAGGWIAFLGLRQYDLGAFMGIRAANSPQTNELALSGIHQWVRHPLYCGGVLILLAYLIYSPTLSHLIFVGVSLAYLVVGIYWEEQKLIAVFGEEYLAYQKRVKALIPFLW